MPGPSNPPATEAARGLSELAAARDGAATRGTTRDDVSELARETLKKGLALEENRRSAAKNDKSHEP